MDTGGHFPTPSIWLVAILLARARYLTQDAQFDVARTQGEQPQCNIYYLRSGPVIRVLYNTRLNTEIDANKEDINNVICSEKLRSSRRSC